MNKESLVKIIDNDLTPEFYNKFLESDIIAVDTETSGLDWEFDTIQLCQIFSPQVGTILVRCGKRTPDLIQALMEDPNLKKVLHFAPFDLRFMAAQWNTHPSAILCTKTASKLVSPDAKHEDHSLSKLIYHHLGLTISKGPVRTSDWAITELTEEQIKYAASDVVHLINLLEVLTGKLDENNLSPMFKSICDYIPTDALRVTKKFPDPLEY